MDELVEQRLRALQTLGPDVAFGRGCIGLEKESLRVDAAGEVALTPHPPGLGSALTNAYITTDFSEALLEFITPPFIGIEPAMACLDRIHRFAYAHLGDEILWATSMPCRIAGDESLPIARYGSSNVGRMKHYYRRGLSYRYGRTMQVISGVHFNYSLPDAFWPAYASAERANARQRPTPSSAYFGLIRNFQRFGWIIPYLFGSSPAVCKSFLVRAARGFDELDSATWYQPHATSLRMSDIGYKNSTQAGLAIAYDDLDGYVQSLTRAIETPHPAYEEVGVVVDGERRQLNCNILQIENEYYSFIRPKQIARSGEKPTLALKRRGVRYVEVRALDVSPFDPVGVNDSQLRFLEAFLILCLLARSPPIGPEEQAEINRNQQVVATRGREPGLALARLGGPVSLRQWATEICESLQGVCEMLDRASGGGDYARALGEQREAVVEPAGLPSSRVLAEMRANSESFFEFAMRKSGEHRRYFKRRALGARQREQFEEESRRSLVQQRQIEAADRVPFDEYLRRYFDQTLTERERLLG